MTTRRTDIGLPSEYPLIVLGKGPSAFAEAGRTSDTSGWVSDIRVVGGKARTVDQISIRVYDVATPSAPVMRATGLHSWAKQR